MTATQVIHTRWTRRLDVPGVLAVDAGWSEAEMLDALRPRNRIGMIAETGGGEIVGHMIYELHRDHLRLFRFAAISTAVASDLFAKLLYKLDSHRRTWLDVPFAVAARCGGVAVPDATPMCRVRLTDCPRVPAHWRTDAVRWMCRGDAGVYLPVLADALEDAGCECGELLALFRAGGDVAGEVYEVLCEGLI